MQQVTIQCPDSNTLATFVPEYGALGSSIQMPDKQGNLRELLYIPDSFDLNTIEPIFCGWPFCFPICGRLAPGGRYPLGIHGFAQRSAFQVVTQSQNSVSMRLSANDATLAEYPFQFVLTLTYAVSNGRLTCDYAIENCDKVDMPCYAGFHPYFYIDPQRYDKSAVQLHLNPIKQFIYNDTLDQIVGSKPPCDFPVALDQPHINESLFELSENVCELHFPDGHVLSMQVKDAGSAQYFKYLQLYHIPEAPFFCLEPWMEKPNALNTNEAPMISPGNTISGQLKLSFLSS